MDKESLQIIASTLPKTERTLNEAYRAFNEDTTSPYRDVLEIRLQVCIFQFDLTREMLGLLQNPSNGFASSVALKGLVHKLFEYESLVSQYLKPKLLSVAQSRNVYIDNEAFKEFERQTRPALKKLRKWNDVRNKAAGHYDADIKLQAQLISTLNVDEVFAITADFLQYNMELSKIVRDAGKSSN